MDQENFKPDFTPQPDADAPPPAGGDAALNEEGINAQQMEIIQRELDDAKSRLLRMAADYQNYAKRSQQSLLDARRQELVEFSRTLLPVLDLFDKATAVDADKTSAAALLEGMKLVKTEMHKRLAALGVQPLVVQPGEAFDPEKHEALMRQNVEGMAPNHIALVLEPGYLLGDMVIRPAKVSVSA